MDGTTKTRKQLLEEIATLRDEMDSLRRANAALHAASGGEDAQAAKDAVALDPPLAFPTSNESGGEQGARAGSVRTHQAERDQQLRDFRAMVNTLAEGVISLDGEGKLVFSNAAARAMLRWRPFELAGQPVHNRIHPPRADGAVCSAETCPILAVLASEDDATGEDTYYRSDGSSFPVRYTISPWRVRGLQAGGLITFNDISRQVQVEAQLAAAQEGFRATLEQVAVGIAHVNLNGKIRWTNQFLADMLGYSRQELSEMRASDLAHPEDYTVAVDRVGRFLAGEKRSYSHETRMIGRDGSTVWTNVTGSLVQDVDGSPKYLLAVIERIDQRKALEQQLIQREREATRHLSEVLATLDAIPHAVAVFDVHGKIVRCNSKASDILGHLGFALGSQFSPGEANQHFSVTMADGRPMSISERPLPRVLAGEVLTSANAVELRLSERGGATFSMSVTGAPVRNEAGQIVAAVCVFRDIALEQLLKRELADRVSQLEATFDAMTDGVLVMDAEGTLVQANAAYRRFFASGRNGGEVPRELSARVSRLPLRDTLGRVVSSEEMPSMRVLKGQVLSGRDALELIAIDEHRHETPLIVTGAPIRDAQGMVVGGVCIYRDVGERRSGATRTRDLLRQLLSLAVELSISATDWSDRVRSRLAERTPIVAAEICEIARGKLGCQHVGLIAIDPLSALLRPVAATGMTPDYEREWRTKVERSTLADSFDAATRTRLALGEVVAHDGAGPPNGHDRSWVLSVPIRVGGALIGILACEQVGDLRDYSSGELNLARAVAEVGGLVLVTRGQAPLPSVTESEGVSGVSPLFTQLLAAVIPVIEGSLVELRHDRARKPLTDGRRARVDRGQGRMALRALESDRDALQMLLEFQQGTFALARKRVDLVALIGRVVERWHMRNPLRRIMFGGSGGKVWVLGDARRLRWALDLLLRTTITVTPADLPVEITIRPGDGYARIEVCDGGPPLTYRDRAHLADLFYEPVALSRRAQQGMGVGMALCRMVVEAHGGQWEIASSTERGAAFHIALPLVEGELD